MASAASGAGATPSASLRWPDSNKVYTRKSLHKPPKTLTPQTLDEPQTLAAEPQNLADDEASTNHHPHPPEKRPLVKLPVAGALPDDRRQIRRRLNSELDRVRDAVRKLESHQLKVSSPPEPSKLTVSVPPSIETGDTRSGGDAIDKEKRTPKANPLYRSDEFILGKDKLPPMDSSFHKKSKGGKKNLAGEVYDRALFSDVFRSCKLILGKIMKHKFAWVFNTPVDVQGLGLHDYFTIVTHPMDLGTVKSRLAQEWYASPLEFAEDVRLTFRNAMTYNLKGQDVHSMAQQLSSIFEEQWPAVEEKFNNILHNSQQLSRKTPTTPVDMRKTFERSNSGMEPMAVDSRPKQVSHFVPHTGRKPSLAKPKAKDLDKREMTFEEKQKLSRLLQSLPPEKLDAVVAIIKKHNSNINQSDEEIEVDIDSMDTETLWELDRFVINFKKSLSKYKRKLERAMEAKAMGQSHNQDVLQGRNAESIAAEVPKSNGTAEHQRNAATSSPAHHDGNDNGPGDSSSSSSDSGSSSSDSESDSSSDN